MIVISTITDFTGYMLYSILPASVAIYFLIAGIVVQFRFSKHPSHMAFVILCATTFVWQFTWAILFQTNDPVMADILIKIGYLLIIFLPFLDSVLYFFNWNRSAGQKVNYQRP